MDMPMNKGIIYNNLLTMYLNIELLRRADIIFVLDLLERNNAHPF